MSCANYTVTGFVAFYFEPCNYTLFSKRKKKKTIDLLAYFLICWKYLKELIVLSKKSFSLRKIIKKSQSAYNSLLKMIGNWEKNIGQWWKNKSDLYGPFKSFWKDQSQFTICKLKATYDFSNLALSLPQSYLCNGIQRGITNGSFNTCNEVITRVQEYKITRVPRGSILRPLLFNMFLNYIFISKYHLCN